MARRIRIVSGLVLFAFVAMHLANVALGLKSIAAMDAARPFLLAIWTNPVGALVLALALGAHLVLGLAALYRRNTLAMTPTDAVQFAASLAIVPLLTPHVVGTAVADRLGIVPTFASLIPYFWIYAPLEGLRQVLLLTVAWVHGCIGVYTYARIQPWWPRVDAYLYPIAVAIPVLALLGFVEAGNQAIERWNTPETAISGDAPAEAAGEPQEAQVAEEEAAGEPAGEAVPAARSFEETLAILSRINWTVFWLYLAAIAGVLVARQVRLSGERRRVRVAFADGPTIEANTGLNLLEIARLEHLPMAQLCRGRGRCGTCRVRIVEASAALPPPQPDEIATLARVGAGPDARLSCQLQLPAGTYAVERLVAPYISPRELHEANAANAANAAGEAASAA